MPVRIDVVEATAPVLLLFLSADCLGCRDLWAGLAELQAGLGRDARLAVVTKEPPAEDPAAIAALAADTGGRLRAPVVMSYCRLRATTAPRRPSSPSPRPTRC